MLIIAVVVFYIFIVNKKITTSGMFGSNSKLTTILKEKDYDFLLIAKYGDRVYDPNEVFMKRVRNGVLVTVILVFLFLSQLSCLTVIIALVILVGLAICVLVHHLMFGTACSECVQDNYRNELCEHCKYFADSLSHSYLNYCKTHDKYEPTEGEEGEEDVK